MLTFVGNREGFDPFLQDTKPEYYPDHTKYGDLILSQKYIQREILESKSPKKEMLVDLLNLLQFI